MVAMRSRLAHQYAELDQRILQNTVDHRLDEFIELVHRPLEAASAREES